MFILAIPAVWVGGLLSISIPVLGYVIVKYFNGGQKYVYLTKGKHMILKGDQKEIEHLSFVHSTPTGDMVEGAEEESITLSED